MRYGFTTGSCAAAAAKAAAYILLTGLKKTEITIETPKGILYNAKLLDIKCGENEVSCAVEKDGGDDPDITTGTWIYAKVSYVEERLKEEHFQPIDLSARCNALTRINAKKGIIIEGGIGVGRVTKPGLDQPVGNAAINRVPREMIKKEVLEVCRLVDYKGGLRIEISVPEGEKLCERTFNPRLGIVGGISILGTSGIVEPMSSQSLIDTIRVELRQRRVLGFDYVAVSPGNYGLEFMRKTYGYDLDKSVKCSNFIGAAIDMAVEMGFQKMLLTGHIGKLIKVAGGIMNTHSKEADCRMELLAAFFVKEQIEPLQLKRILECATTEEAVSVIEETGKLQQVMEQIVERICYYMENRAGGKIKADCILFSNEYGELAKSKGAEEWFTLLGQEQAQ
ncbi:MAG: cobalt-precorrin-5B (C(1))-methyltransferase CbiD [Lachnospiraceae bacterium]|nr:cobalt-precorrin-5B (C(1))-methyltransferase CbiD [Lachnospiraceae bacterium]